LKALDDGILWILWETILLYYEVMELISEKLRTGMTSMAIIDSEEATFGPILILTMCRLGNIQND
jgi:hypothetical protein